MKSNVSKVAVIEDFFVIFGKSIVTNIVIAILIFFASGTLVPLALLYGMNLKVYSSIALEITYLTSTLISVLYFLFPKVRGYCGLIWEVVIENKQYHKNIEPITDIGTYVGLAVILLLSSIQYL